MFSSCGGDSGRITTVGGLAGGDPLYIEENGEYVPFLVVTDRYAKNSALLLRQEVLPEDRRMNGNSSYYAGSEIDGWLNGEYLASLGGLQEEIAETDLVITADSAIGYSSDETETVPRKVFLLSCAELGFDTSVNAAKEGKMLPYFKEVSNRIASGNDQPAAWLLRTPNTYFLTGCYAVGADGSLDTINAYDETGIRPAFCVDSSREIIEEEVTEGGSRYVLR